MAHMRVGFAHAERRRIAQRTKVALAARRAQGLRVSRHVDDTPVRFANLASDDVISITERHWRVTDGDK
jgi:DNA invertase Pin-like site-specific DNA recombinase